MKLEGKRYENYTTQSPMDTRETFSLYELKRWVDNTIEDIECNKLDPRNIPVFIEFDRIRYVMDTCALSMGEMGTTCSLQTSFGNKFIYEAPDSKPTEGEYWTSRGPSISDCSGFVVSKKAGERLLRLVKYALDTDTPKSWLDYREYEPNWIQFKFSAEEFDVEKLHKLSRENNDIVTETILNQCKL